MPHIHAFEVVAVANLVAVMAFLRLHRLRPPVGELVRFVVLATLLLVAFVAAAVVVRLLAAAARGHAAPHRRRLLAGPSLLLTARVVVATVLVFYAYGWLKVTLPLTRDTLYDGLLWRLDIALHLGGAPVLALPSLLASWGVLHAIDVYYLAFVPSVMALFGWFATHPSRLLRRRFALGYALLWAFGGWLYVAVPALGPCYTHQPLLRRYYADIPGNLSAQGTLWINYQRVRETRMTGRPGGPIDPNLGVAAFPSLHVAGHLFFALMALRRRRQTFALVLGLLALLTGVGAVATGWHYAVDVYAGALLALGCAGVAWVRVSARR